LGDVGTGYYAVNEEHGISSEETEITEETITETIEDSEEPTKI
jgi:hypothetical protein